LDLMIPSSTAVANSALTEARYFLTDPGASPESVEAGHEPADVARLDLGHADSTERRDRTPLEAAAAFLAGASVDPARCAALVGVDPLERVPLERHRSPQGEGRRGDRRPPRRAPRGSRRHVYLAAASSGRGRSCVAARPHRCVTSVLTRVLKEQPEARCSMSRRLYVPRGGHLRCPALNWSKRDCRLASRRRAWLGCRGVVVDGSLGSRIDLFRR
jgi:hypothetical protein